MSLRSLPEIKAFERPAGLSWDAPSGALARWTPGVSAAETDDDATISIYDVIGEDMWSGGGWTAKRMAGVLRSIGKRDVTVAINSPGGDYFDGAAIYGLLREHPAKVTVKIMGIAASAASIIAMAGDEIRIGRGAFVMIHNASVGVYASRHELRRAADLLESVDQAMSDIYVARTGGDAKAITKMMDEETYMSAAQAVEHGFADAAIEDEPLADGGTSARADLRARHQIDTMLARQGVPRSERRRLLRDLSGGTHDAATDPATPRAGSEVAADLRRLIETLKS